MTHRDFPDLPRSARAVMMVCVMLATSAVLYPVDRALAQQSPPARNDLDVTMQIIADPDARTPEDIVRRIPLPAHKPAEPGKPAAQNENRKPDAADKGQERAREAQELGREMSESARDKSKDAAEQREQARRSITEQAREHPNQPPEPPGRPPHPPRL